MTDTHAVGDTAMDDTWSDVESMTQFETRALTHLGGEADLAPPPIHAIHLFKRHVVNGRVEPTAGISSEAPHASAVTNGLVSVSTEWNYLGAIAAHLEGREQPKLRRDD